MPPPGAPPTAWSAHSADDTRTAHAPSNLGEDHGAIPDLDDRYRPLDPRIITFWRLSTAIAVLVPGSFATLLAGGLLGRTGAIVVAAAASVLAVGTTWWYPAVRYRRWRWRLTDLAVELDRGVLVRTSETLPYFRIQQIDVNQGPVDRLLELASLEVTSASASGSVRLPGITASDAPGVRRALLARASRAATSDPEGGVRDAV